MSVILECSQNNADLELGNSDWTNTFQKPILIPSQSAVMIKNAFLNTNQGGEYLAYV